MPKTYDLIIPVLPSFDRMVHVDKGRISFVSRLPSLAGRPSFETAQLSDDLYLSAILHLLVYIFLLSLTVQRNSGVDK